MTEPQATLVRDSENAYAVMNSIDAAQPMDGKNKITIASLIEQGAISYVDVKKFLEDGGTGIPTVMDPEKAFLGLAANPDELPRLITSGATIQSLLSAGVTAQDFQAVNDQTLDDQGNGLMFSICGGSMTKLAQAARTVTGSPQGGCYSGVKAIYRKAGLDAWLKNSGGSGYMCYMDLERSGHCISISFPNSSYENCNQSGIMQTRYFEHFLEGTTLSMDNIKDCEIRQKVIAIGKKKGKSYAPGATHGHATVITNDPNDPKYSPGRAACDGVQKKIYVNHYGPYVHATFPKDAYVPEEYAMLLLERVLNRQLQGITLTDEQVDALLEIAERRKEAAENTPATNTFSPINLQQRDGRD